MSEAHTLLQNAIDRNAPAAITLLTGGMTRLCRSRLLAGDAAGVWVGLPTGQSEAMDALAEAGKSVRVTFKCRENHVEFTAPVLERRRAFRLNADTHVEAVRLAMPKDLAVVQRRGAYRVAVGGQEDVTLRVWRIGPADPLAATPPAGSELDIDVRDFSNAGVGGVWKRRRGEDAVLPSDQRLRVDVVVPGATVTLEAFVRFMAALPEPEYRRIGLQFMFAPANLADRAKLIALNRIAGELQRAELRRLRTAR